MRAAHALLWLTLVGCEGPVVSLAERAFFDAGDDERDASASVPGAEAGAADPVPDGAATADAAVDVDAALDDDDDDFGDASDEWVPCSSSAQCPGESQDGTRVLCNVAGGFCAECLSDADCEPGETCEPDGECDD